MSWCRKEAELDASAFGIDTWFCSRRQRSVAIRLPLSLLQAVVLPLCAPGTTWLWEWKTGEFPWCQSVKGDREPQEEQRCCSGVGCDRLNMGQRWESMPGLENAVKLEIWGTR